MQTVGEWKKGINSSNQPINQPINAGLTSVSDWKKTRKIVDIPQPITPQPKQSFLSNVETSIKNYAQASADTVIPFGNAILHPLDTLKKLPGVFTKPFMAGIKKASTPVENGNVVKIGRASCRERV